MMNPEISKSGACVDPTRDAAVGGGASLVVVGTGIQWAGQTTLSAQRAIERAESVLFAVADPWAARWVRSINPRAESFEYPRDGRPRREIYRSMVARVLDELRAGKRVCAVFYGSPAVLTSPAHESIRQARAEGFRARMCPGVSSLDCLFVDLGVDPGDCGCLVYEAGDFLIRPRTTDLHAHLVLFQLAVIGNRGPFQSGETQRIRRGLRRLSRRLTSLYGPDHEAVVYEASAHPFDRARADRVLLCELAGVTVSEASTLYVGPKGPAPMNPFELEDCDE